MSATDFFHSINDAIPDEQEVVTVPPGTPVHDAVGIMRENDFSQLPVVQGNTVMIKSQIMCKGVFC